MFEQFQQMKQLREMQKKMKEITVETEHNGIHITLDGNFSVRNLSIENTELSGEQLETAIAECFNRAVGDAQKELAQQMQGSM